MKITKRQLRRIIRENMAMRMMNQDAVDDMIADDMDSAPKKRKVGDVEIVDGAFEGTTDDRARLTDELKGIIQKLKDDGKESQIPKGADEILAKNHGDELLALRGVLKPSFMKRMMGMLFPEGKARLTETQLRQVIREVMAGSPTIGKPSAKGTDHLFTDTYGLGREDSLAGMNPQSADQEYMRGYNEAQLDSGLPKVQPPSEPATANKLDPNKLKDAFVSSEKDRSEMAEYIRKRNERMAKLKMSENKLRKTIRSVLMTESASEQATALLKNEYTVVSEKDAPGIRRDTNRITTYTRNDGQPVPPEDLKLLQDRDDEVRKKGGGMARLMGVYTSSVSQDGNSLIVKYHRTTAG